MKWSEFSSARAACAYFFILSGLTYGQLTARMPALKMQTGANEEEVGYALLCLGIASLITLAVSDRLIARWGSSSILRISSLLLMISLPLFGMASSPAHLILCAILAGFCMGLVDVAINTQGIQVEHRYRRPCMSLMHASYSCGGLLGSLTGSLFAGAGLSVLANFLSIMLVYACLRPLAVPRLQQDILASSGGQKEHTKGIPVFVLVCGILAMLTYSAEGSIADWGSLLLFTSKGASEHTAALVFGAYSGATALCRLFGDRLRIRMGDTPLMVGGAMLAACSMLAVLLSPWPLACLAGYVVTGIGLSPIVPILFSRAGSYPGISAGKASVVVSFLAYGGMLMFPPTVGWLAVHASLDKALFIIPALCFIVSISSLLISTPHIRKP